jgi:hypothetical protein
MVAVRAVVRDALGTLASGELFVNCYRDMDAGGEVPAAWADYEPFVGNAGGLVNLSETEADEVAARIIRYESVRQHGISHHEAMQVVRMFYE